jgi:flagellar basal body rod protein FlgG
MMVSLGMLGVAALAGCHSSHPTTKPSSSDECDCCPPAAALRSDRGAAAFADADAHVKGTADLVAGIDAAIMESAFNLEHAEQTGFLATRAEVDGDGNVRLRLNPEQGALDDTSRPLDIGIQGSGFFRVMIADSAGDRFAYTRNGNFFVNGKGELVLGVGKGHKLHPLIRLPNDAVEITVSQSGIVEYKQPGVAMSKKAGDIRLARFVSPQSLSRVDGNDLYAETSASGAPTDCVPGDDDAGITLQGFLEASNVKAERERMRIEYLRNWREAVRSTAVADAQH